MAQTAPKIEPTPLVGNVKKRREQNRKVALNAIEAGLAIFLTRDDPDGDRDRRPLWLRCKRLDTTISQVERLEIARTEGYVPPHFGSTRAKAEILRLLDLYPDGLPAMHLGINGLIAIDPDVKNDGPRKLAAWLAEHGHVIPEGTPITRTQSGGNHYFFRNPDGLGSSAGELKARCGCDVKGGSADGLHGSGYTMLPGIVRSNGATYQQSSEVGLYSSFKMGTIPHLPSFFAKAIGTAGPSTSTTDAELAPLIAGLREADPDAEAKFEAADLVDGDKDGNRSDFRMSVANRMRSRYPDATIGDYFATLLADPDRAGTFVGDDKPGSAEYNTRNIARDWARAGTPHVGKAGLPADTTAFGVAHLDTSDDVGTALAAIDKAIAADDLPADDERDRLLYCLHPDRRKATRAAFETLNAALMLGSGQAEARAALAKVAKGEKIEARDATQPKEAKATKAGRNTPFQIETQHQAAERVAAMTVEPLIDGMLDQGALSVLYGPSNSGKSFVAAHIAYSIAAGLPWAGNATSKGAVLFFALEGRAAFRRRVVALSRELDPHVPEKVSTFAVVETSALDLKSPAGDAGRVIATVRSHEAATGEKVLLIVIDTMAAASPGMSENDGRDVTLFVEQLKRIRDACPAAHVLTVHHTGKDAARGARGHSALRAAIDTEIEIAEGRIATTKQRDLAFLPPIAFRLRSVNLGDDDRGRPMRTAIVELGGAVAADFGEAQDDEPTAEEKTLVEAVRAATAAKSGLAVAPGAVIVEARRIDPHLRDVKDDTLGKKLRRFADEPHSPIERVGRHYRLGGVDGHTGQIIGQNLENGVVR